VRRRLPVPRLVTVALVAVVALALIANFRATPHIQKGRLASIRPAGRSTPAPVPASPPRSRSSRGAASPAPPRTRRVAGAPINTRYGVVQVRITTRGSRIVSVTNLALPFDRSRSLEISRVAGPLLRSEALQAQSARIDVVSGATYTSDGYAQSLQSAIDRARA
jgi:uncharacterized protein with FMN-binding domain